MGWVEKGFDCTVDIGKQGVSHQRGQITLVTYSSSKYTQHLQAHLAQHSASPDFRTKVKYREISGGIIRLLVRGVGNESDCFFFQRKLPCPPLQYLWLYGYVHQQFHIANYFSRDE